MPDTLYKEVLITVLACMVLFVVLTTIILLFVFKYQQRRRLQQMQVLELQQQFKEQSLRSQIEIQEQTFQAISQEIHDNVGQVLSLAKVQVNIIRAGQHYRSDLLEALKDNIGKAMADLRDLSRSLNSERLRNACIHEAIQEEAERINRTGLIQTVVAVEGLYRDIHPQKKLILYRIVQESLQNCLKHAAASQINILCEYRTDNMIIQIQDNGVGFDPEAALTSGFGQGLTNIRTRVHLTGGNHTIQSVLQQGTQITLTIPYE
jgi:two-component system, NarL family, sensor kinase